MHLAGDYGGCDGPVVGQVGVHDRPQDAVALQAQVAWLAVRAAVAEERAELQLQVHPRRLTAGGLPLDRLPVKILQSCEL